MAASESTIVIDEPEASDSKHHEDEGEDDLIDQSEVMTQEQAEEEWNQLTVEQLKEELEYRQLSTTGKKADLVARLVAHEFEMEGHNVADDARLRRNEDYDDSDLEGNEDKEKRRDDHTEADEDNPEGVEFVEWNEGEDAEHEMVDGEEDISDEAMGPDLNESHDDDEPRKKGRGDKSAKHDASVEEGDIKAEEGGEYDVDVAKNRDIFTVNWHGKKLTVPFKNEIIKDLQVSQKIQSVVAYPVELADIYLDAFRKHLEKAVETTLRLEEMKPGIPSKGLLKMKFLSLGEALDAIEELKSAKEGVTVKHFCTDDFEGVILSQLHRENCDRRGSSVFRLLYVGNLPSHVTERSIKEAFPDALQVILPYEEDTMERTGYAYLEYKNEEEAFEASEKYKDLELEGEKLYVIKAVAVNKEKFGLLRDSLRLYWQEQINKFRRIIDRSHGRNSWEVTDAEKKMNSLKNLLDKDKRRREELRLPIPDIGERKRDDSVEKDKEQEGERKHSKERRRSSLHSARDSDQKTGTRRIPLRRSPFIRREGSFRSGRGGRGTGYNPRSEAVANKLVNQLQGLVSALTNKLPDAGTSAHPPSHHSHQMQRRHYPEDSRYGAGQGRPNYSRNSGYYDDHRTSGPAYQSSYTAANYHQSYPSYRGGYRENPADRYSAKRYRSDDGFSPDRKKRMMAVSGRGSGYMDHGSSSRYPSSRVPYAMSSRRGGISNMSAGRPYARPKTRGSYNY